jgi:hypothetical protein
MFTSTKAVFECKESVALLVQRWHSLIVPKAAWDGLHFGPPKYRGVVSEQRFDLTMYLGRRGFPVICRGEFQPLTHGTRVRVQFSPAITLGRMIFLAGACVALAVLAFVVWISWGMGVPLNDPTSVALGVGVLTLICVLGAGVGIAYFMLVYWMAVRFAQNDFRCNLIDPGPPATSP